MTNSPNYYSFFDTCAGNVKLWSYVYVYNMGTPVGTVGTFYNIMEWVSDEEADRLEREDGMQKAWRPRRLVIETTRKNQIKKQYDYEKVFAAPFFWQRSQGRRSCRVPAPTVIRRRSYRNPTSR